MSSKILKYMIENDVVDRTAQEAYEANTTLFPGGSGDVPDYMYLSVKTILLGVAAASSELANRVVEDVGTAQNHPAGSIVITSKFFPSQFDDDIPNLRSDQVGAETAFYDVKIHIPRRQANSDIMTNLIYRLTYVLDYYSRTNRTRSTALVKPGLDILSSVDNTILPISAGGYYKCYYLGLAPNQVFRSSENSLLFKSHYVRIMGK